MWPHSSRFLLAFLYWYLYLSRTHTELKKLLVTKDELVTDLTNIRYRHSDAVEKLTKIQADSDKQLVDNIRQIQDLAANQDLKARKLADLEAATQAVVEMVEEGDAGDKTLVEHLREAPQKITSFLSDTSRQYLAHALGLVVFLACSKLNTYWQWVSRWMFRGKVR